MRVLLVGMLALSLAATVVGCGRIETTHVVTGRPMAPTSDVQVYMQGQQPPPGYVEIAIVQTNATGTKAKMPNVVSGIRARARQLGCSAVINLRIDQGAGNTAGNGVCVTYPTM